MAFSSHPLWIPKVIIVATKGIDALEKWEVGYCVCVCFLVHTCEKNACNHCYMIISFGEARWLCNCLSLCGVGCS